MSLQNDEDSDFDFSIIDKKVHDENKLNFSVQKLLEESSHLPMPSQSPKPLQIQDQDPIEQLEYVDSKSQCQSQGNQQEEEESQQSADDNVKFQIGSFMHDLNKFEEELSFETKLYNVYQEEPQDCNGSISQSKPVGKSLTNGQINSLILKTTKEDSQEPTTQQISYSDYGYLVLDFAQDSEKASHCSGRGLKKKKITSSKKSRHFKYQQKCHTTNGCNHRISGDVTEIAMNLTNVNHNNSESSISIVSPRMTSKYSKNSRKVQQNGSKKKSLTKFLSPKPFGHRKSEKSIGKNEESSTRDQLFKSHSKAGKLKDENEKFDIKSKPKHKSPSLGRDGLSQPRFKHVKFVKRNQKSKNSSSHSKSSLSSTTNRRAPRHEKPKGSTKSSRQNAYSEYYGFEKEQSQSQNLALSDQFNPSSNKSSTSSTTHKKGSFDQSNGNSTSQTKISAKKSQEKGSYRVPAYNKIIKHDGQVTAKQIRGSLQKQIFNAALVSHAKASGVLKDQDIGSRFKKNKKTICF